MRLERLLRAYVPEVRFWPEADAPLAARESCVDRRLRAGPKNGFRRDRGRIRLRRFSPLLRKARAEIETVLTLS